MKDPRIAKSLSELFRWAKEHDFAGHDPHDLLSSPLLAQRTNPALRLVALQLGRRSIIDVRSLLRVPNAESPKGLALFLTGLLRAKDMASPEWATVAETLGTRLVNSMSPAGGWGYPFPWQSRTHFLPAQTPNIVTTSFVGNALIDLVKLRQLNSPPPAPPREGEGNKDTMLEVIELAANYVLSIRSPLSTSTLSTSTLSTPGVAFGYAKDDPQIVFNASLLGAEFLMNAGRLLENEEYVQIANRAAEFVVRHQERDGSWQYGLERSQRWVDSFHTGFVIVSLKAMADALEDDALRHSANKGFEYYRKTFIDPDFAVRYYHDQRYPIDAHAMGQAMVTLTAFGDHDAAHGVARWAIEHLRSANGYFYYQRHRALTNRIAYMRWSNAWMFRGLAEVVAHE